MRLVKKLLAAIYVLIIISSMLFFNINKLAYSQIANNEPQKIIKVGVLLYRFDDTYISLVRKSLEEIQKKNPDKVEFIFYDGKNDQKVQNNTIDTLLKNKSVDLLFLNLVDVKNPNIAINRIKQDNIPVVLFNREPIDMGVIQSYSKACFVGTNAEQAGVFQGRIIINIWEKNKDELDINGDNILQYVMLMGESENKEAIERTKYSVLTITDSDIKTQELSLLVCNWNRELAKEKFEPIFMRYGEGIEAIISNNDEMAIGAIEVLQKYGYNKGNNAKKIDVIGVDATPEAQEMIKKGEMTGSVLQDAPAMAEACYYIGMNLANGKNPLYGTTYKYDNTGVAVRIPYKEYIGQGNKGVQ